MKSSLTLHLPEELKQKVEQEAKLNKVTVNQYIVYTLTKEISVREAERWLRDRIEQAPSGEDALQLLESIVPDRAPFPEDRL
ncbi:MAG: hypothetical protein AB1611_05805 [bacterium]